jgi:hypothetical protein
LQFSRTTDNARKTENLIFSPHEGISAFGSLVSGARFLKQDRKSKRYYGLNIDQVHEKTGHAIRDFLKTMDAPHQHQYSIICKSKIPKSLLLPLDLNKEGATLNQTRSAKTRSSVDRHDATDKRVLTPK